MESDINRLAEQADMKPLVFAPVETGALLADITAICGSLENLGSRDTATFTLNLAKSIVSHNNGTDDLCPGELIPLRN